MWRMDTAQLNAQGGQEDLVAEDLGRARSRPGAASDQCEDEEQRHREAAPGIEVLGGIARPGQDRDTLRLSTPARIGVRHPKLAQVIKMMEDNIEDPISPANLAKQVGMSTRQLERLFRRYLTKSPKRYYMELRLQKARNLLMQTDMSVINVALACGFTSPSHFSKCYRAHYDTTPYRERGSRGAGDEKK